MDAKSRNAAAVGVTWTAYGKRSFAALMRYLDTPEGADVGVWAERVIGAIEKIRSFPFRCVVACIRRGKTIRRLVVDKQVLVYYAYIAPRKAGQRGRVSIRGVHHAARRYPLAGIREPQVAGPGLTVGLWIS